jgi:quercetin dioxygenase-like cupin family protein
MCRIDGIQALYSVPGQFCFQPIGESLQAHAFVRHATVESSVWHMRQLVTWLARGRETAGRVAVCEMTVERGHETPLHLHTREDELCVVLEGVLGVTRGEEGFQLKAGEPVFFPRGSRHGYKALTERIKVVTAYTPAGIEEFLREFSRPARSLGLPNGEEDPIDYGAIAPRLIEIGQRYGLYF